MSNKKSITKKSNSKKVKVSVKVKKSQTRGILNGFEFFKHVKRVHDFIDKNPSKEEYRTRYKRTGSPKTFIVPEKISATTYENKRATKITFSIGFKLPQVLKQVYNNHLILDNGVIYGFEKKWDKISKPENLDIEKSNIVIKKSGKVITLTNFINNTTGKVYKMTFKNSRDANKWFKEVLEVGTYKQVVKVSYVKS